MMTLRRHLDPGGTINDKEEMIAGLSRAREDLPGRGLQHRGDPADRAKLAPRAVFQDGYALQIAHLLILAELRSENDRSLARLVRGIGDRAVHHAPHDFHGPSPLLDRLLRLGDEWRKKDADSENDCEHDQPHGHLGGGRLAGVYPNATTRTSTATPM
jgi:hypothetical protein